MKPVIVPVLGALVLASCVSAFGKNCGPGDVDDVRARAQAMAAKNRPIEAEKLLAGAWAACGKEIVEKGDAKQEARRRDFLFDWLDLAARAKSLSSCLTTQSLIHEHVPDLGDQIARVKAAKMRCDTSLQ